ncbi:PREDICTED: xyloglucan endotransglucosylase/hydrolase [Prunus dulcis]|uniref:PREDICTED: xyloglucan endotransglucosylase/hydrolase n=1 Tax=Prunus dulcis TaxID=3755 RepID=A0A5E4EJJ3_PRUDU|nr:PREDICTED: xyloglucan endotransglucosylase/hydrolase [Prunus dulcis]
MAFPVLGFFVFLLLLVGGTIASNNDDSAFDKNYEITWGNDHVLSLNQGREIQLSLDSRSGYHHHLLLLPLGFVRC